MSYDIRSKLIVSQNLLVQASITGLVRTTFLSRRSLLPKSHTTEQNYLNPIALERIGWRYYVVIDVVIAVALVNVYFTYPETSRITLEEVGIIFDGKHALNSDDLGKIEKGIKDDVGTEHREVANSHAGTL